MPKSQVISVPSALELLGTVCGRGSLSHHGWPGWQEHGQLGMAFMVVLVVAATLKVPQGWEQLAGVGKGIHDMTLKLKCVFRFGWEEFRTCKRSQPKQRREKNMVC